MSSNITDLVLTSSLQNTLDAVGLSISIERHTAYDVAMPTTDNKVTLVSFESLAQIFSDFHMDNVGKHNYKQAVSEHLASQGIDPSTVQVSAVYRVSKRCTELSSCTMFSRNELVGFCYMVKKDYEAKYPHIDQASVEEYIHIKMKESIGRLGEWQHGNNYTAVFKRGDEVVYTSNTMQKVDWEHFITYRALALDKEAA